MAKYVISAADVVWFESQVPDAHGEISMTADPDPDLVPYSVWKRARMERDCAIADRAKTHSALVAMRNEREYWHVEARASQLIACALALLWLIAAAVRWL